MVDAEQCNSVLGQQSDLIGEHCIKRYRSHFLPMHGQLVAARSGSEKRTKGKRVFMTFDAKHHRSTLLDWYTRKDLCELNEQLAAGDIELFKRIEKTVIENPRRLRTAGDIEKVFASVRCLHTDTQLFMPLSAIVLRLVGCSSILWFLLKYPRPVSFFVCFLSSSPRLVRLHQ